MTGSLDACVNIINIANTRKASIRRKAAGAYHHGDLKEALKKAALRLVLEKGPRGFSLTEASRLAGVTAAAPYRHFADKEALLAEIALDGLELFRNALQEAADSARGVGQRMLETGMAYLRFASAHSDYFSVIFNSGLDKSKYPALDSAAQASFGVILGLAESLEPTKKLARTRALAAWALVHGLATLVSDGALSEAGRRPDLENFRPVLEQALK